MKRSALWCFVFLLPVGLPELAARWWMAPAGDPRSDAYPALPEPAGNPSFLPLPELFKEVKPSLHCTSGWMGNLGEPQAPIVRIGWFEWDEAGTVSTLEAFKHLPEECMGAAGMRLEKIHPPRLVGEGSRKLIFDSTRFRPEGGSTSIHVFKCVWVSGWEGVGLREGAMGVANLMERRHLRLAAAKGRFRPPRARVLMVSVTGLPSEDLAWRWAGNHALGSLQWVDEPVSP